MNACNKKCDCDECSCHRCGCTKPTISVTAEPTDVAVLKFNFNGVTTKYDYRNMITQTQTDTSIYVDVANRVMEYMAERHTDSISAKELGSILHLSDIGDVNFEVVEGGSMLVYQKDSNCAEGCEGIDNSWVAYNALDHIADNLQYSAGYDANGTPKTLGTPTNTNQYYQLGWNAENKLSYSQPTVVATAPVDSDNKKWALYVDPDTKALVIVKES